MLDPLLEQHRQLLALTAQIDEMVGGPTPDAQGLAPVRLNFSRLLREHLALEEELVYAPLRAHGGAAPLMAESDKGLLEQRLAYSGHVSQWTPERIAAEWPQYRAGVTALTRGLAVRIAYEQDVVFPCFQRLCGGR